MRNPGRNGDAVGVTGVPEYHTAGVNQRSGKLDKSSGIKAESVYASVDQEREREKERAVRSPRLLGSSSLVWSDLRSV